MTRRWLTRSATAMLVSAAAAGGAASPAAAATAPAVRPTQQLAKLLASHTVLSAPSAGAKTLTTVAANRPITGGQTVLPVTARTTSNGAGWLRVMVPGRPHGTQGWIVQRATMLTTTRWHVVVRTKSRRVHVYRDGRIVRAIGVVVGKPSTPTPHGRFFVEESILIPPTGVGGPFALATSARSNVLQEFAGGPGQIGLHGVAHLGGTPGTAVSHGCVRLSNRNIGWLAARIGPGVPVTIAA